MVWQSEADGLWWFSTEGKGVSFPTQQEALNAMTMATQTTVAQDMAATIIELTPKLKAFYSQLVDMTGDWNVNKIPGQIEAAIASQAPLGGYDPTMFIVMGEVFKALQIFMQTPVSVPEEVTKALAVPAITPEFAIRYKWLPVPEPVPTAVATYQPLL